MPAQTVMFIENTKCGKQETIYLLPENINQIQMKENSVIVPMHYDEELFRQLQIMFPQGAIQEENGIWRFIKLGK